MIVGWVTIGMKVSVAEVRLGDETTGDVHRATVIEIDATGFICTVHVVGPNTCGREFASEGTLWCRGWEGEAVDALRAFALMA